MILLRYVLGALILQLSIFSGVASAGSTRDDKEQEIRDRYDWVIFGGEYGAFPALAIGLDATFFGGQMSIDFAKSEAQKFGVDLAKELAKQSRKGPITGGVMRFTMWEKPLGVKVNIGDKFVPYIGVLKPDTEAPPPIKIEIPDKKGYTEFRRRIEEATTGKTDLPPLTTSVESQWIRYICGHSVGNNNTRDGYKEFRRRLDVAYQYRYLPEEFKKNYEGKPNLDLPTIPPALPADSKVGAILKSLVGHCVGNPDGEAGYGEWHRRAEKEILPGATKTLSGSDTVEGTWTLYILNHLVGNRPVIEEQAK